MGEKKAAGEVGGKKRPEATVQPWCGPQSTRSARPESSTSAAAKTCPPCRTPRPCPASRASPPRRFQSLGAGKERPTGKRNPEASMMPNCPTTREAPPSRAPPISSSSPKSKSSSSSSASRAYHHPMGAPEENVRVFHNFGALHAIVTVIPRRNLKRNAVQGSALGCNEIYQAAASQRSQLTPRPRWTVKACRLNCRPFAKKYLANMPVIFGHISMSNLVF